jgi:hypothetical protein
LDSPINQAGVSSFGRTKIDLAEEDDCSTSSSDDDNDDNDTDNKYDDQELLLEFQKLTSKHMKLTMKDPTRLGYQSLLNEVIGGLRCIGSLTMNKKVESLLYCQVYESLCKYWSNVISRIR